jgi:RimJ/RimL family protein N-acetyltransferase
VRKAILLALLPAAFFAVQPAQAAGPLQTAIYVQNGDIPSDDAGANAFFKRIKATGATAVRLTISWSDVAPAQLPPTFHPKDPAETAYNWTAADRAISLAVANGLTPLVDVLGAPAWAGGKKVSAPALGDFATAITSRYIGSFEGLPRVRYWLVWNEPNLTTYLAPQVAGKKLVGAARYRSMVNAFAAAAHSVRRDNVVVAGLVAPFTFRKDPGPLTFMKAVLAGRTEFDVWAVHPYTSGGPRHHAQKSSDLSLGDLPRARSVLDRAVHAHHIASSHAVQLWVTEFSWDSKPPDSHGVPVGLEAQWVSEALFRAWQAGVSMFTWFLLRDDTRATPFQSGLYFRSWQAKPALAAFRFPFVALRRSSSVYVWGRTPGGRPATAVIERKSGRWVGRIGPWEPEGWPRREIAWGVAREFAGRGYAHEAAVAAIDYAVDMLGWTDIAHHIDPANTRSIRLAERLGAVNRGPTHLPAPLDALNVDNWGQGAESWRARRQNAAASSAG